MAIVERRTIDELIVLYRRERSLHDVVVEGDRDRSLFRWFASRRAPSAGVLTVDHIDIPSQLIVGHGERPGRRGAVITLALEIAERAPDVLASQLTCVADRDGEDVSQLNESVPGLLSTDYSSIELYYFQERVLEKLLLLGSGRMDIAPATVIDAITPTLLKAFAIRRANLSLELGLEWLSFDRCCEIERMGITFDADDFMRRYLSKSGKLARLTEFVAEVERHLLLIPDERRLFINGHDFVSLLTLYLAKTGILPRATEQHVESLLRTSVEDAWLSDERLFERLSGRLTAARD
jgi:hypothetical protein